MQPTTSAHVCDEASKASVESLHITSASDEQLIRSSAAWVDMYYGRAGSALIRPLT